MGMALLISDIYSCTLKPWDIAQQNVKNAQNASKKWNAMKATINKSDEEIRRKKTMNAEWRWAETMRNANVNVLYI